MTHAGGTRVPLRGLVTCVSVCPDRRCSHRHLLGGLATRGGHRPPDTDGGTLGLQSDDTSETRQRPSDEEAFQASRERERESMGTPPCCAPRPARTLRSVNNTLTAAAAPQQRVLHHTGSLRRPRQAPTARHRCPPTFANGGRKAVACCRAGFWERRTAADTACCSLAAPSTTPSPVDHVNIRERICEGTQKWGV